MNAVELQARIEQFHSGPLHLGFDRRNRKQVEEIKSIYMKLKTQGRTIIGEDKKPVEGFSDVLNMQMLHVLPAQHDDLSVVGLRIFDETGDRRISWQASNPTQVKEAKELFDEYMAKGWKAYAVHRIDPNKRGLRILGFSDDMEEVIFDDKSNQDKMGKLEKGFKQAVANTRQRLQGFAEAFSEIKMVPKTYPG